MADKRAKDQGAPLGRAFAAGKLPDKDRRMIKVRATEDGYYGERYIEKDVIFEMAEVDAAGASWVRPLTEEEQDAEDERIEKEEKEAERKAKEAE
jgi:hypothetical protein